MNKIIQEYREEEIILEELGMLVIRDLSELYKWCDIVSTSSLAKWFVNVALLIRAARKQTKN